ncbi:uncharacterized protein MELLADRAFT_66926 [Melampsora larici-populina 98AG31]|uniref:Uncharacterized protein n=1 Tax=Melampsora larici-populina (strain 98AG31 / pathotype 3-4-7) TaxID=747676 RepID=F4S149_MELLP|nr:uncharacterized protein MELLADRAFT_66926 [Melampsora larici-populina 98AG31]EGG01630.1 hypothetical protein MELLADRAFT_66926 [Melampsora larici-populina 98AG31]
MISKQANHIMNPKNSHSKNDFNSTLFQPNYPKKLNNLTSIQTSLLPFFQSRIRFIILAIITTTLYITNQPNIISTKFKLQTNHQETTPKKSLPKKLNPSDYSDELLLSLPILISTSNQPFDPINEHKPLPNHLTPFTTQTLMNQLKTPPKSNAPKKLPYPSHPSAKPHPQKVLNTTIKDFEIASKYKLPTSSNSRNLKSVQYLGFKKSKFIKSWETREEESIRNKRKEWVKNAFLVVWEGYKAKAWGHDELKPISGSV